MKPLLKLLTPTMSSLAIASSALCITSCNKQDSITINFVLVDNAYGPKQCTEPPFTIDFEPNIEYVFKINIVPGKPADSLVLLNSDCVHIDFKDIYEKHMSIFHDGIDVKRKTNYVARGGENCVSFGKEEINSGEVVFKLTFAEKTTCLPNFINS